MVDTQPEAKPCLGAVSARVGCRTLQPTDPLPIVFAVHCVLGARGSGCVCCRFIDVQRKWEFRNKERLKLVERIKETVARQAAANAKKEEIVACRQRIKLLQSAIYSTHKRVQLYGDELRKRRDIIKKRKESGQKRGHKTQKRQKMMQRAVAEIDVKEVERGKLWGALCEQRCLSITDLVDCIFPVEEITTSGVSTIGLSSESLALSTVTALKEASLMTYMSGQWILTDHNGNTFFKIVESRLPGHGDYSVAVTKGAQSMMGYGEEGGWQRPQDNPAYAVLTGLSHMTQLVLTAADVLHVCLPRKVCFSEFCRGELNERQLQNAVSRLNHNVLYLCFSQGVDVEELSPRHTIRNLIILLHSPHLARYVNSYRGLSFTEDEQMVESVNYGSVSDESEDEVDGPQEGEPELEVDWVRVDRNLPEMKVPTRGVVAASWTVNTATYAGHMLAETHSTASGLVTSAAASVASFWRAAASRFENR
ncbi:hypothetical protein BaRGS_00004613 [Batillaria attramentaria]|uniref:Beclin 1-associated autophagy-related key regulator n=1 Tax=Batillaria attramentaria TaxID=370345 RepID=A0ABD0LZ73_9CAEN